MNVFIVLRNTPFQVTRDNAAACLTAASEFYHDVTFTFKPITGRVFANPGSAHIPCGVLYETGYLPRPIAAPPGLAHLQPCHCPCHVNGYPDGMWGCMDCNCAGDKADADAADAAAAARLT